MQIAHRLLIALSVLAFASAPALAATDLHRSDTERQRAGFVGIHLRLDTGHQRQATPIARFVLGFVQHGDAVGAPAYRLDASWLELGLSKKHRPELYVNGQRLADVQKKLGIAPAAAVALGLGAIAAGAVIISTLDDDLNRRQCLLPEKELCAE